MMLERVREILSWYEGDNPGTRANMAGVLNSGRLGGAGRLVILPIDQGFEHGPARSFAPNQAGYEPDYHFQLAIDAVPINDTVECLFIGGGLLRTFDLSTATRVWR